MTTTLINDKAATLEELLVDRPRLVTALEEAVRDAKDRVMGVDDECDDCYDQGNDEACEWHVRAEQVALSYDAAHRALLKLLGSEELKPVVVDQMQIGDTRIQILSDGSLLRELVNA